MELWTPEHLKTLIPTIIFMFVLCAVLKVFLGKKSHKTRMIPFQIFACIIFLLEVGKQVMSLYKGYDLYHLPFHFCSLFIFMLPLMAFYKGRHKESVYSVTVAICAAVFLIMIVYPALIYPASDLTGFFGSYFCFHTVVFHNIVMLEFLLILFLDLHKPAKGEFKGIIVFTVCYNVVAAVMAQLLKTNFNNMYTCNIPPLEVLRQSVENSVGLLPSKLLYMAIVAAVNVMFVCMSFALYRFLKKVFFKKKEATAKVAQHSCV